MNKQKGSDRVHRGVGNNKYSVTKWGLHTSKWLIPIYVRSLLSDGYERTQMHRNKLLWSCCCLKITNNISAALIL